MDEIGLTICYSYHVTFIIVPWCFNYSQLVHSKWIVHQQKWQRGKDVIVVIVVLTIVIIIIIILIIILIAISIIRSIITITMTITIISIIILG